MEEPDVAGDADGGNGREERPRRNADGRDGGARVGRIAHGALRGAIAAMAMTGMRAATTTFGLVEQEPPEAILGRRARRFVGGAPRRRWRGAIELAHWGYGAAGGAVFASLPDAVRLRPWFGPIYGLVVWLGFELLIAPALGLAHARGSRVKERAALAADHALYGFVLSETRRRPQR